MAISLSTLGLSEAGVGKLRKAGIRSVDMMDRSKDGFKAYDLGKEDTAKATDYFNRVGWAMPSDAPADTKETK